MTRLFRIVPILALPIAVGCGASAVPATTVTDARAAVSAADAVGAQNNPQGALYLKMARDEIRSAQGYMNAGENDVAVLMLRRARADAELALAVTREREMRARAVQAQQQIDELERQAR